MTCSHCAQSVRRALLGCAGVTTARVDLAGGQAAVSGDRIDPEALRRAVTELGYGAEIPEGPSPDGREQGEGYAHE
jgi:copper chaperone CopZ